MRELVARGMSRRSAARIMKRSAHAVAAHTRGVQRGGHTSAQIEAREGRLPRLRRLEALFVACNRVLGREAYR